MICGVFAAFTAILAERKGFEPLWGCPQMGFKTTSHFGGYKKTEDFERKYFTISMN